MISIRPCYVDNILNGIKKYEYRKRVPKLGVKKLIIYETAPFKRAIGEVDVLETICLEPNNLWKKTKIYSGIDKSFFDSYFMGKSLGYAYRLGAIRRYKKPKTLDQFHIKAAPQSYVYINR